MFKEKYLIYRTNLDTPETVIQGKNDNSDPLMTVKAMDFQNPAEKMQPKSHAEALALVKKHKGKEVVQSLDQYAITDYKELALTLVKELDGHLVMDHFLDKLDLAGRLQFLNAMIDKGEGDLIAERFKELRIDSPTFRESVALKIAASNEGASVAARLPNFEIEKHDEIAQNLIDTGKGYAVARNITNFKADHYNIALSILAYKNKDGLDHIGELKARLPKFILTPEQRQELTYSLGQ